MFPSCMYGGIERRICDEYETEIMIEHLTLTSNNLKLIRKYEVKFHTPHVGIQTLVLPSGNPLLIHENLMLLPKRRISMPGNHLFIFEISMLTPGRLDVEPEDCLFMPEGLTVTPKNKILKPGDMILKRETADVTLIEEDARKKYVIFDVNITTLVWDIRSVMRSLDRSSHGSIGRSIARWLDRSIVQSLGGPIANWMAGLVPHKIAHYGVVRRLSVLFRRRPCCRRRALCLPCESYIPFHGDYIVLREEFILSREERKLIREVYINASENDFQGDIDREHYNLVHENYVIVVATTRFRGDHIIVH